MALIMSVPNHRAFFGTLNNPSWCGGILDRDFDDDENRKPLTADCLTRQPIRAKD